MIVGKRNQYTLDFKVVGLSFVLWYAIGFGVSLVHEAGHAMVCASSGYEFKIWFDGSGGHTLCYGTPESDYAYSVAGPVLGVLASSIPLAVKRVNKMKWLVIPLLAWIADQSLKIVLEPIGDRPYFMLIFAVQTVSLIALTVIYGRKK